MREYTKTASLIVYVFGLITAVFLPLSIGAQDIVLNGKVYYEDKSQPLQFATIKVVGANKETLSDCNGCFTLNVREKDTLVCSYIGCKTEKSTIIGGQISIEFTLIPDTFSLEEIVIEGIRRPVSMSPNGLVVSIDNIRTEGKQTIDILRQMPTLKVSDQTLSMFAKTSVLVYINGRRIHLQGRELVGYLNSLPPNIIKKVEIITTPPSQYEAEGDIGIVKIETSKSIDTGLLGRITTVYGIAHYPSYGGSIRVSYTGKNFIFENTLIGRNNKIYNNSNYTNYFQNKIVSTHYPRMTEDRDFQLLLSSTYDINKKNQISATFQMPLYNKERTIDLDNITKYWGGNHSPDSVMTSIGNKRTKQYLYSFEVFYKYILNGASNLKMTFGYIDNYVKSDRTWESILESEKRNEPKGNFTSLGQYKYNIYTVMADYNSHIGDWELSGGYKTAFTNSHSNNLFYEVDSENHKYDIHASNLFDYKESINAVYLDAANSFGSLSLKVGFRAEYTQTKGYSHNLDKTDRSHHFRIFPVAGIDYMINKKNTVSIAYSSRIKRPYYQMLNPFRWYISKYDYSEGNPSLKPAYIDDIKLAYINNNSLYCELFFSHINNEIGKMVFLDTRNIQNQIERAGNFLNISSWGLNANYRLNFGSWHECTLSSELSYSNYDSHNSAFKPTSGWACVFSIDNYFHIGSRVVLSLYVEDNLPGYYKYRKVNNSFLLNASISYTNKKKDILLRLSANDILKTANPSYSYYSNGVKQVFYNYYDSRYINLVVIWNFGNIFNANKMHFRPSNTEERNRL